MAKLSPVFNDQTFDANGDPAVGYKLFTYVAGSSTKQATYTDSAGTTPQTNPIILNASGYPTNGPIWLTAGQNYKFVLASSTDTDPPTSPLKTIDNVSGVNDSSSSNTQWVSSGVTPSYVSATSFTLSGDQTTEFHVGRRLQMTVTAGTVYGTIAASVFGALTTITVTMDSGMALDSGLSTVNLSILRADKTAIPPQTFLSLSGVTTLTAAQDRAFIFATGTGYTITLPSVFTGRKYTIYTSSINSAITVASSGGALIFNGGVSAATFVIPSNATIDFVCVGTDWIVSTSGIGQTSLAASGYEKAPNGRIIQWGAFAASAAGDVAVTFPLAFPNAVYEIVMCSQITTTGIFAGYNTPTVTGFNGNAWVSSAARANATIPYIAIGK